MNANPTAGTPAPTDARHDGHRRGLLLMALVVTVFGLVHHLDHAIRGHLVLTEGLPPEWNHSGLPLQEDVTGFTASLGVYVILLGGVALTLRRRAWAGYWLVAASALLAILLFVHFFSPQAETPQVIWNTYGGGPLAVLALTDLFALLAAVVALGVHAVVVRRRSGRWRDQRP